jgi:malonyl CoA-acyl carrier protein transacylase
VLFPGQGSQTRDMRELVAEHRPDLLERATEACGSDPFERIADGTAFAQPAMYAASIASWERAGRPEAVAMAGHSLGELAALAAAESMDALAGLDVAVARGRIMQRATEEAPPGGMLAVLGDEDASRELAAELDLIIANHNAPGQLVLSGPLDRIEAAATAARARKLKSMRLPIAGAFHSPSMAAAVDPFREVLDGVELAAPRVPVYSCTTARPFGDIREELAEALVRPVEWTETLEALREAGAERFVEPGPGKVLTGLVKRTLAGAEAVALEARDA